MASPTNVAAPAAAPAAAPVTVEAAKAVLNATGNVNQFWAGRSVASRYTLGAAYLIGSAILGFVLGRLFSSLGTDLKKYHAACNKDTLATNIQKTVDKTAQVVKKSNLVLGRAQNVAPLPTGGRDLNTHNEQVFKLVLSTAKSMLGLMNAEDKARFNTVEGLRAFTKALGEKIDVAFEGIDEATVNAIKDEYIPLALLDVAVEQFAEGNFTESLTKANFDAFVEKMVRAHGTNDGAQVKLTRVEVEHRILEKLAIHLNKLQNRIAVLSDADQAKALVDAEMKRLQQPHDTAIEGLNQKIAGLKAEIQASLGELAKLNNECDQTRSAYIKALKAQIKACNAVLNSEGVKGTPLANERLSYAMHFDETRSDAIEVLKGIVEEVINAALPGTVGRTDNTRALRNEAKSALSSSDNAKVDALSDEANAATAAAVQAEKAMKAAFEKRSKAFGKDELSAEAIARRAALRGPSGANGEIHVARYTYLNAIRAVILADLDEKIAEQRKKPVGNPFAPDASRNPNTQELDRLVALRNKIATYDYVNVDTIALFESIFPQAKSTDVITALKKAFIDLSNELALIDAKIFNPNLHFVGEGDEKTFVINADSPIGKAQVAIVEAKAAIVVQQDAKAAIERAPVEAHFAGNLRANKYVKGLITAHLRAVQEARAPHGVRAVEEAANNLHALRGRQRALSV